MTIEKLIYTVHYYFQKFRILRMNREIFIRVSGSTVHVYLQPRRDVFAGVLNKI